MFQGAGSINISGRDITHKIVTIPNQICIYLVCRDTFEQILLSLFTIKSLFMPKSHCAESTAERARIDH